MATAGTDVKREATATSDDDTESEDSRTDTQKQSGERRVDVVQWTNSALLPTADAAQVRRHKFFEGKARNIAGPSPSWLNRLQEEGVSE